MKRTLSLLLVLAMVIAMIPNVFATTGDKPDIEFDDLVYLKDYSPISVDLAADAAKPATYLWVPAEDGKLSYDLCDTESTVSIKLTQLAKTETSVAGAVSLDVVAGEEVTIEVSDINGAAIEGLEIEGTFAVQGSANNPIIVTPEFTNNAETEAVATINAPVGTTWYGVYGMGGWEYTINGVAQTLPEVSENELAVFSINNEGEAAAEYTITFVKPVTYAITKQPETIAEVLTAGDTVTFTIEATGAKAYQWYWSKRSDGGWQLADSTTDTLSLTAVADNALFYMCKVTYEDNSSEKSVSVTYKAQAKFEIVSQSPLTQTVVNGTVFTLSLTATGNVKSYQWYKSVRNNGGWGAIAGATDRKYSMTAYAGDVNYYMCIVTATDGATLRTTPVQYTTYPGAEVTSQAPVTQDAEPGQQITLYVTTDKDGVEGTTYQWLRSRRNNGGWNAIAGEISPEYTFTAIPGDKWYYCCLITDMYSNKTKSEPMEYVCESNLQITNQTTEVVHKYAGQDVSFFVEATGDGEIFRYQWFKSKRTDGGWMIINNASNPTLTIKAEANNVWYYMCKVIDQYGIAVKSVAATYTAEAALVMNNQSPATQAVVAGESITLSVDVKAAAGQELHYAWYQSYRTNGGWKAVAGAEDAAELTLTAEAGNTLYYKCIITDSIGNTMNSRVFTYTAE